jgi:hypothetical protein
MTIAKKLVVSRISTVENGIVEIQIAKILEENGIELSRQWHRTTVEPGADIDATITDVIADLATPSKGNFPSPNAADIAKMKALTRASHTAAVVKAFRDRPPAPGRPT